MAKLYYSKLTNYQRRATDGLTRRKEKLEDLRASLQGLASSEHFQGVAADHIAAYLQEVHINGIINGLLQAVENLQQELDFYVVSYPAVDENGVVFKLIDEDLVNHQQEIGTRHNRYSEIFSSARKTMSSVSNIETTSGLTKIISNGTQVLNNLNKMKKIAYDQQTAWHRFEADHAKDFAAFDSLIGQLKGLVNQYAGGSVPTMAGYQSGGFNAVAGEGYAAAVAGVTNMNQARSAADKQARQSIGQIRKAQKQYANEVKRQKRIEVKKRKAENRQAGWADLMIDGVFIFGGAILAVASGGAAMPLILLIGNIMFGANTLLTDANKISTGNDEGNNFLKDKSQRLFGRNVGDVVYESANFASGIVGSGGAYKELAEKGIVVGISKGSESILSGMDTGIGQKIIAGIGNTSRSVLPKLSENVTMSTVGKEVVKTYGKEVIVQGTEKVVEKEVTDPASEVAEKFVEDGVYETTGNKFISESIGKTVENGMKKGTGKASDKVINSSNEYVKHSLENTVENAKLNQAQSIIKTLGQQNGQREFGKYKGGY
ncbi:hypothetical protein GKC32_01275 [Lactobacillus curvatus]|nr:hypothetical protein [Latilactobacillus curvatus]MSE23105.1 hypothetical protein [Latilactobacillus curvatus]